MAETHLELDLTTRAGLKRDAIAELASRIAQGDLAARSVATYSARTTPMTVASHKMNRALRAESPAEANAIQLADVLENILAFCPQPVEVRYHDGKRFRRAYPDLGLVMLDGSVRFWEVKDDIASAELVQRLGRLSAALQRNAVGYRVVTSRWLASAPRMANVRELRRNRDWPFGGHTRASISAVLDQLASPTLGALQEKLCLTRPEILAAAAQGVVAVDIGLMEFGSRSSVRAALSGARSGGFIEMTP